MTNVERSRLAWVVSWALLAGFSAFAGEVHPAPPSTSSSLGVSGRKFAEMLARRNTERATALESYQGRRIYSLDYTGFFGHHHAEMVVDMTYNAPDSKQFTVVSQTGSKWVITHIFKRLLAAEQEALQKENQQRSALNSRKYNFTVLETERLTECNCYVVEVEPKVASKFLYRGRIWVDAADFAVRRIEAEPAKNPSFWIKSTNIRHRYEKVGDFWLPSEDHTVSSLRLGGKALLTIEYQNYKILAARHLPPHCEAAGASPAKNDSSRYPCGL
jgi:hypothetical protein